MACELASGTRWAVTCRRHDVPAAVPAHVPLWLGRGSGRSRYRRMEGLRDAARPAAAATTQSIGATSSTVAAGRHAGSSCNVPADRDSLAPALQPIIVLSSRPDPRSPLDTSASFLSLPVSILQHAQSARARHLDYLEMTTRMMAAAKAH